MGITAPTLEAQPKQRRGVRGSKGGAVKKKHKIFMFVNLTKKFYTGKPNN